MPRWWMLRIHGARTEGSSKTVAALSGLFRKRAPTELLVALHTYIAAINYSPNVAMDVAEYFQTVIRTIFENAIDRETGAQMSPRGAKRHARTFSRAK